MNLDYRDWIISNFSGLAKCFKNEQKLKIQVQKGFGINQIENQTLNFLGHPVLFSQTCFEQHLVRKTRKHSRGLERFIKQLISLKTWYEVWEAAEKFFFTGQSIERGGGQGVTGCPLREKNIYLYFFCSLSFDFF